MALGGKRVTSPISGKSVTEKPVGVDIDPVNPQENLDGIVENQPVLDSRPTRRSIVDSQYMPPSHLILHAKGDPWTVDYYRQMVGMDDELAPQQLGTAEPHQQYELIRNYELKVDSPLSQSQNAETKEFEVDGQASLYFGIKGNVGDMFTGDVGEGRLGLFTVTDSRRLSYTKSSSYQIDYKLVSYLDNARDIDLTKKVVREFIFERKLLELMDNPFMTRADHETFIGLEEHEEILREHFMRHFWSSNSESLSIPQQERMSYDLWHATFCKTIGLGDFQHPISIYTNGYVKSDIVVTLWDMLVDMSDMQLPYVHSKFGLVPSSEFKARTVVRGIGWTHYQYTLYPQGEMYSVDRKLCPPIHGPWVKPQLRQQTIPFKTLPNELGEGHVSNKPLFYPVNKDDAYVLSEAFYDTNLEDACVLEWAVSTMLAGKAIKPSVVEVLAQEVRKLQPLDQFYYIPLVLTLIIYSKRGSW